MVDEPQIEDTAMQIPESPDAGTAPVQVPHEEEPVYSRDEIIAAAAAFGATPYLVAGALRNASDELTKAEAQQLIDQFKTREV